MAQVANAQELVVRLAFDQVFDRILPFPKMTTAHKEIEVRINGKGEIRSKRDSVTGSRSEFASHDVENMKLGPNQRQEWRVVSKDKLIYIVEYPTFREAILLTVSGSACNAEVDFELKPGFTEYRYTRINGDPAVARSAMATRLTCAVSQP
jgi:hypothetical protein